MGNIEGKIDEINKKLEKLPKGTLTYKNINGKEQPYLQRTINGKSVSYYVRMDEREEILIEVDERNALIEERRRLEAYKESIANILENQPYLDRLPGIGWQHFNEFMEHELMYVDKTHFICRWWNSSPKVSLITRPRRFGKTLMMSTVQNFFDPSYAGHEDRFEKLAVWQNEKCRRNYGRIPVIFISFADVKGPQYDDAMYSVRGIFGKAYRDHGYLENSDRLDDRQKKRFTDRMDNLSSTDGTAHTDDILMLSELLYLHYGVAPIILLDEYDTPLTEAYVRDYFDEIIGFYKVFINQTFKTNDFLLKAIITGINKVSKNALFSDMNNVQVYSMLHDGRYEDCFGFTEDEVRDILKCQDSDYMDMVKFYYDGFTIGNTKDIYNPWSICCFLEYEEFRPYWINTSSNNLIGDLMAAYPNEFKEDIADLVLGKTLRKSVNEDLALQYMKGDIDSFWALMAAVGYVKVEKIPGVDYSGRTAVECNISSTNKETTIMLQEQIRRMLKTRSGIQADFAEALIAGKFERANDILDDVLFNCISYFDGADAGGGRCPAENFYHGLVLGMIVALRDRYDITSNRESGRGRYDICMVPIADDKVAFIIEFKVRNVKTEKDMEETAANALKQIEEKGYEAGVLARGIAPENIKKVGIAFDDKDSLVVVGD